ncbi:MAG: DNA helicase UvrD, partial [Gammaproteobacteria bacterium]
MSHEIGKYHAQLADAARRLGRDGSGRGFQKKPDWKKDVQTLVDLARSNGLDAPSLKAMARNSVAGLKRLLGKENKKLSNARLGELVEQALEAISALDDQTGDTTKALSLLRRARHALANGYVTWGDWASLAKIKAGKTSGAHACLEEVRAYAMQAQHHPQLHKDIETLITGVFDCAAEALEGFDTFKRINGLMDFVDQESKVLELLDDEQVRQRLAERIDVLMVDEFQDTSPIQLALFSKIGDLVARATWVGDQKQAIYGFRGTDPKLMDDVIATLNEDQLDVLKDSWRSRPGLVRFVNATFVQALAGLIPAERVRLNPKRKDHPDQTHALSVWKLNGRNKDLRDGALVKGIADLISKPRDWMIEDRHTGQLRAIRPGDIAVLCRTNAACASIAEALADYGIQASVGSGSLLAEPECIAVLAGLRLLVDGEDTLALAELVQHLPGHASGATWLAELSADPEQAFQNWKSDDRIRRLLELREKIVDASPMEIQGMVADILGVRDDAFGRANPAQVLANLERLEQ